MKITALNYQIWPVKQHWATRKRYLPRPNNTVANSVTNFMLAVHCLHTRAHYLRILSCQFAHPENIMTKKTSEDRLHFIFTLQTRAMFVHLLNNVFSWKKRKKISSEQPSGKMYKWEMWCYTRRKTMNDWCGCTKMSMNSSSNVNVTWMNRSWEKQNRNRQTLR